jgi:ATP-binding cassette subfamily C protein
MKDYKIAWSFLNNRDKRKFYIIILLFIILSLLEIISIGAVIPFTAAIFSPDTISSIKFLKDFSGYLKENQDSLILIFCSLFFIIFLLKNIFLLFVQRFINYFISDVKVLVGKKLLTKFLKQEYLFFMSSKQGKLITILNSETQILGDSYIQSLMVLISEILILIGILTLIILTDNAKGLLIVIPIAFLVYLFVKKINKKIKSWSNKRVILAEDLSTLNQRIFLGIRDIYFSANIVGLIDNYSLLNKGKNDLEVKNNVVQLIPRAILEITGLSVILGYILYLTSIDINKDLIISNLTFYFLIAYRSIPSFNKILIQYQRIKYSKNSIKNIDSILSLKDTRDIELKNDIKFTLKDKIVIKNISFGYNKLNSISNVNFEIKKGELIGIYGESGSGKSTLLNILTLLIRPDKGNIYIDQKNLEELSEIKNFQTLITFISQDTFLLEDSIKNNIVFETTKKIDEVKLEYAINFSEVDKFLDKLPEGIDTLVGSNSRKISSGQRQRIALARAIYNLNEILVLDEATNALDVNTEMNIMRNIKNLRGKKTIIIVSHKKENLKDCDTIYEVKNNSIKVVNSR